MHNTKVVNKSFDAVWASTIPSIGKAFFVINNLDKNSGLVNVSYSGDPEKYIDCGVIRSDVSNMRGQRSYEFPAASAYQTYEIMQDGHLFFIERKMDLDGRVNLIFEPIGKSQTRVTANTKYVVRKSLRIARAEGGFPQSAVDSISFGAGSGATFAGRGASTRCVSNGRLEQEVLDAVN
jgi:hypothetical protein